MAQLPLLEHVKTFHPSLSLSNVLLVGCQHILGTTHTMLRSLYSTGLNPKNIFLLGKCYSTNRSVWQEMHKDGIRVSPLSFFFDSQKAFDDQFSKIVSQFLKYTLSRLDLSKFNKIILIDDGGQLLCQAMELFKGHPNVIAIEQTTSGFEKIKSRVLSFPIINVARSQAKLIYESPMIAETVVRKAIKRLESLLKTPRHLLIIGNGAIGSSIYNAVKNDYRVQVYDKTLNDDLYFDETLRTADLIIGCTGETSLHFSKYNRLKKGCVLFSASSSDREFDAVHLRKKVRNIKSCHDDVEAEGKTILNCGFPINFDGGRNSVAPSKIQLTRALLMSAIFQACEMPDTPSEIVPLDIEIQRDIISRYLTLYPAINPNIAKLAGYQKNEQNKLLVVRK